MNRIQLFEFEDFPWLPNAVRDSMTRMLTLLHGAVSNARTYTLTDLDELLLDVPTDGYQWTKGLRSAGPMKQIGRAHV